MNYAATDPLGRWVGLGRPLHALEIDYNFYNLDTRVTTLEASITTTVSISSVTQPTSTQMQINLSNSASYTLTMPTATFVDRGAWLPATAYFVNDTFTANGSLYRVVFDHTSASTFSPTANDGAGHDYYAAMMSNPGNALPAGGAAGMFLKKSTSTDYAVSWSYVLPNGGTTNQVLAKLSNTDQNYGWLTLGATMVSFSPSTASGLTSTNVSAALEEIEASIDTKIADAIGGGFTATIAGCTDVQFATGDPQAGALFWFGGSKWAATAPLSTGQFVKWDGTEFIGDTPAITGNLSDLTDVNISSVANGDSFYYDGSSGKWRNRPSFNFIGSSGSDVVLGSSAAAWYQCQTIIPTGNLQITEGTFVKNGHTCTVIINTSGGTSYNITAGAGVTMNGTLATGTSSGKLWTLTFVHGSSGYIEIGRTGPM